jgi:hypothetical protein
MFYVDLFRCLHERRVRYLLVGGLAMNLHGVPRMTMDVDLILAMDDANLDAFLACAHALALKPQAPVPIEALKDPAQRQQWIASRNLVAFALAAPGPAGTTVDILLRHALDIEEALRAAATRVVDGVPVRLCAIEDMIVLKQGTGRRQDASDVEHLRRIQGLNGDA